MSYDFAYSVRDDDTGASYSHMEQRAGNKTNGEYRVSLPDGRVQVVSYVADEHGYQAKVSYEPASPPPDVYSALKYAPGAATHRQFAPRRHGGKQRRPPYKRPRTRPANRQHNPDHLHPHKPSSLYTSSREDNSHHSNSSPSDTPLLQKEDLSSHSLPKDDFYLPETLSSYLPTSTEKNVFLPELSSSYLPTPKEEDFYFSEHTSSYLPTPKKEELNFPETYSSSLPTPKENYFLPDLPLPYLSTSKKLDISEPLTSHFSQPTKETNLKYSSSSTLEQESANMPESLPSKNVSSYELHSIDSLSFPGPPKVDHLLSNVFESAQHPYSFSPSQNSSLKVTTYRPKHQIPLTSPPSAALGSKNSSPPSLTTTSQANIRPLKLPEVINYKPSRPLTPYFFSPTPKTVEEEQDSHTKFSTVSPNSEPTTHAPFSSLLPSSYPLSPTASQAYSHPPHTAPSYSVSIPVPYTPAPIYGESSPIPYSPPQPPYFGPKYGPYFPGPTYPPRITGLPPRIGTI